MELAHAIPPRSDLTPFWLYQDQFETCPAERQPLHQFF